MTLTKADMTENLIRELDMNKNDAKEFVDSFFEEMSLTLENGEKIKLSGFGNFDLRDKKQRPGRNPKTKEEVAISARRVVTFRSGQKLRQQIMDSDKKCD